MHLFIDRLLVLFFGMTLTDVTITFINGETEAGTGFCSLPKVTQLAGAGIQTQAKGLRSQHLTHQLGLMDLLCHHPLS